MSDDTVFWREANRIFLSAVELPRDEVDAFVQRECAQDERLFAAVHRLLAQDAATGDTLPGSDAIAAAKRQWTNSASLNAGDRAGDFIIERVLGHGGMGQVYLARRERDDGAQQVALKIAAHSAAGEELLKRLRRERRLLGTLEHPNIARLIDWGELSDGRPYFAMEYVDGVPVTDYCRDRNLDLAARLNLFLSICEAVAYAHRRLVLHRDLKPSNILVDADGRGRLLDFGIAKPMSEDDALHATADGGRFFSPASAAPEQILGQPTSVATDVYGLGCLLYELLANTPAFRSEGLARAELEQQILQRDPPPVSTVKGGISLGRAAGKDLDAIVAKALRKSPDQRYASVESMTHDLRAVLQARPIAIRRDDRWYRASRFVRRNRVALALSFLLGLSVLGFSAFSLWQAQRLTVERDTAVQARSLAETERRRAEAMVQFLVDAFQNADPEHASGRKLTVEELLTTAAKTLPISLRNQPESSAAIAQTLSFLFLRTDQKAAGEEQAAVARDTLRTLAHPSLALQGRQYLLDSYMASLDADYVRAAELSRKGLDLIARAAPGVVDSDIRYQLWLQYGNALGKQEKPRGEVLKVFDEAVVDLAREGENQERKIQGLRLARANVLAALDAERYEAFQEMKKVLAWQDANLDPDDNERLFTLRILSITAGNLNDNVSEEHYALEAKKAYLKVYGPESLAIVRVNNLLAGALRETGRAKEAEAIYLEGLRIARKHLGNDADLVGKLSYNLAVAYQDSLHEWKKSEFYHRDSIRIFKKIYGEESLLVAIVRAAYAHLMVQTGRYKESEVLIRQALPVFYKIRPEEPQPDVQSEIAVIRYYTGNHEEARKILREWLEPLRKHRGPDEEYRKQAEVVAKLLHME